MLLRCQQPESFPTSAVTSITQGYSWWVTCVLRIIGRLPDGKHKAEELAAAGLLQEAAECAARVRDGDMLSKLQDMIGTVSPLGGAVSQLKDRLQAGVR